MTFRGHIDGSRKVPFVGEAWSLLESNGRELIERANGQRIGRRRYPIEEERGSIDR